MSNPLAIAAVTSTIRNLLFAGVSAAVPGTDVSTRPPDRVRTNGQDNRVNLFLYQTSLDPAWRNQDMPGVTQPGEDGRPPLPLRLHYLVTAYAENDDEIVSHQLLGKAMSLLHDYPILKRDDIKAALAASHLDSDLDEQIESVRITPQPMTLEEMSKLWTTFQTQYRISAAYEACVVLIESTLPPRAPLPVLSRGDDQDTGPVAEGGTVLALPTIDGVAPLSGQPSAVLGDEVLASGHDLGGTTAVRLTHSTLRTSLTIPPPPLLAVTAGSIRFRLPGEPTDLAAGPCLVSGVRVVDGEERFTREAQLNAARLQVAPEVTPGAPSRDTHGVLTVPVTCSPKVVPGQNVQLLLDEHQVPFGPVAAATNNLAFKTERVPAGDYLLRLRVDGVDSLFIDRTQTPPVFDPLRRLVVP